VKIFGKHLAATKCFTGCGGTSWQTCGAGDYGTVGRPL